MQEIDLMSTTRLLVKQRGHEETLDVAGACAVDLAVNGDERGARMSSFNGRH